MKIYASAYGAEEIAREERVGPGGIFVDEEEQEARKAAKQAYLEGLRERFPDDDEERKAWETARRKELGDKRHDKAFEFEELLVTDVDFDRYAEIAELGHEVYRKYDPDFLAPSSDEVYLNMTEYFKFDEREMTPEEKEKTLEDVVEFLRKNDLHEKDLDEPTLEAITDLAGVDMPRDRDTSRQKVLDDAIQWLRNNEPSGEEVGKSALKPLTKLAGVPMPKKLTPEEKEKAVDDVVQFLRSSTGVRMSTSSSATSFSACHYS